MFVGPLDGWCSFGVVMGKGKSSSHVVALKSCLSVKTSKSHWNGKKQGPF